MHSLVLIQTMLNIRQLHQQHESNLRNERLGARFVSHASFIIMSIYKLNLCKIEMISNSKHRQDRIKHLYNHPNYHVLV